MLKRTTKILVTTILAVSLFATIGVFFCTELSITHRGDAAAVNDIGQSIDSDARARDQKTAPLSGKEYVEQCRKGVLFDGSREKASTPKVSILLPVYNKVRYLPLSLRSVQNQSLRDIEIVCLDDGSTDGSADLIKMYQKDDPRIVLYQHEKNMGTLTARAHLILNAKGKYLMWLDPDDAYCSQDIVKMAYEKAVASGVDIVHFKYTRSLDKLTAETNDCTGDSIIIKQPDLRDGYLAERKSVSFVMSSPVLWNKLYTRDICVATLNLLGDNRWMTRNLYGEDLLLNFAIFRLAQSYTTLNMVGCFYEVHDDSVSYDRFKIGGGISVNSKRLNDIVHSLISTVKFIFELTEDAEQDKKFVYRMFLRLLTEWDKHAIAISDHVDEFKELVKMFLDCEYVSRDNKDQIARYLNDVLVLEPKAEAAQSTDVDR